MRTEQLDAHADDRRATRWLRRAWQIGLVVAGIAALAFTWPSAAWAGEIWAQTLLARDSQWAWFLGAFLLGLALDLTPCVYPMIPVTLAFFSGQKTDRTGYAVQLSLLYVVGMSLMYATLGFAASRTGAMLGSWLQQPAVVIGIGLLMVALALSMFGVYELRPPAWVAQRLGQAPAGRAGAFVMGLSVGLIASPCVGPFIIALLVFVSKLSQPLVGFLLLFTTGLGMGAPFVALGVVANRSARWPKAGEWLVWVKRLLGVVLLGIGLHFVKPLMPWTLFRAVAITGLVGAGVYLAWLDPSRFPPRAAWIRWVVGAAVAGSSLLVIPRHAPHTGGIAWEPYTQARLEEAKQRGQPAIVDVYADWCVPCVELDRVTFRHPDVIATLKGFRALRIDATGEVPPEPQALLDRYEIVGVPTVLFFDAQGRERRDLVVNGFIPPMDMLQRLSKASQR